MKNVIIALLLTACCFSQTKKPAHIPTEAESCWRDVSLSTEFPMQDAATLQAAFDRMNYCSNVLKADKVKSRVALQLAIIYSQSLTINKQAEDLKSAKAAQATSEQSVQNLAKAYVDLQTEYTAYQKKANDLVDQMVSYMAASQAAQPVPPPAVQQKRGVFSSFLQGAGEAMQKQAQNPPTTIHCESSTFGNETSTDCR